MIGRATALSVLLFCSPVLGGTATAGAIASRPSPDRFERLVGLYKGALLSRPVRGPILERLCSLYEAGPGLERLVGDYQAAARREPNNPALPLILGHIEMWRGRPNAALDCYRRAVQLKPKGFIGWFYLGEAAEAVGALEEASRAFGKAAGLTREPTERRRALKRLVVVLLRARKWDAARRAWKQLLDLEPRNPSLRLELARLLERNRRWDEALEAYRGVLRLPDLDPFRAVEVSRRLGRLCARVGRLGEALLAYQRALDLTEPGSWLRGEVQRELVDVFRGVGRLDHLLDYYRRRLARASSPAERLGLLTVLADLLVDLGRVEEAAECLRQALPLAGGQASLRRRLADLLLDAGRYAAAAEQYRSLLAEQPPQPEIYFRLADALSAIGRDTEAHLVLTRLVEKFPDRRDVLIRLAGIYRRWGRSEDALAIYRGLFRDDPADAGVARALAGLLGGMGRRTEARDVLRRFTEARSADVAHLRVAAEVLEEMGFVSDAEEVYRRGLASAPTDGDLLRGLAQLLTSVGRYDQALVVWRKLEEADPRYRGLARNQMISIYRLQGRLDEVRSRLERHFHRHPDDVRSALFLADVCQRLGDAEGAVSVYRALLRRGDLPRVRLALAETLERLGRFAEARDLYLGLARRDPVGRRRYLEAAILQCERLGDEGGAVAAARSLVARRPDDPAAWARLAAVHARFRRYGEALAAYSRAMRLAPSRFAYLDAKARLLDLLGRSDEAVRLYDGFLRTSRDRAALQRALAEAIRIDPSREHLEALVNLVRRRIEDQPREWTFYRLLADLHRALGEPRRELAVLKEGLERSSSRSAALRALMGWWERRGRIEEAVAYAETLFARTPDPAPTQYLHLVGLLLRAGRPVRAMGLARRLLSRRPTDVALHRDLVVEFAAAGRVNEVVELLQALSALVPGDLGVRLRLAQLREETGRWSAAETDYRYILERTTASAAVALLGGRGGGQPAPPAGDVVRLRRAYLAGPAELRRAVGELPLPTADSFQRYVPRVGPLLARRLALAGLIRLAREGGGLAGLVEEFRGHLPRPTSSSATRPSALERAGRELAFLDYLVVCEAAGEGEHLLAACGRAVEEWPGDVFWWGRLAAVARSVGRWRTAARASLELARLDPVDSPQHLRDAVEALLATDADDELDSLIAFRLAVPDSSPEEVLAVSEALLGGGRFARAARLGATLLDTPPAARARWRRLNEVFLGAGRRDLALRVCLARFDAPAEEGGVWASVRGRVEALRSAWSLMSSEERRRLSGEVERDAADTADRRALERLAALAELTARPDLRLTALLGLVRLRGDDEELVCRVIDVCRRLDRREEATRLALRLLGKAKDLRALRDVCLRLVEVFRGWDPGDEVVGAILHAYLGANPSAADLRTMAVVLERWGRLEQAAALLEQALKSAEREKGEQRDLRRLLAELYRRAGRLDDLRRLQDEWVRSTPLPPVPDGTGPVRYAEREALLLPVVEVYRSAGRMDELVAAAEHRYRRLPDHLCAAFDLALVYRYAGRRAQALKVLRGIVRRWPNESEALAALGRALMRTGRYEEAAGVFRRLIRVAPTGARSAYRDLARCYAELGWGRRRLAVLEEAARRFQDAGVWREVAKLQARRGDVAAAQRAFERYLDVSPPPPGAEEERERRLSRFLLEIGCVDQAITVLERGAQRVRLLVDGREQALRLKEELVAVCAETGRLDWLLERLKQRLRHQPRDEETLHLVALVLHRQGRFAEEAAYRERLLRLAPGRIDRRERLARTYFLAGRYAEAVDLYRALARRDPACRAKFLRGMAEALFRWGKTEEAVRAWWESARIEHRNGRGTALAHTGDAFYRLALLFEEKGLLDEAERAYHRALEVAVRPTYDLYSGAVRFLMKRGKRREALVVAAAGLAKTGPGPERTNLLDALLPYSRKNTALLKEMSEALASLPVVRRDDELAVEVYRTVGERWTMVGDDRRAAEAFLSALERRPREVALMRQAAEACAAAGMFGRAIELFSSILQRNSADYLTRQALVEVLLRQGRTEEAERLWEEVLRSGSASAAALRAAGRFFMRRGDFARAVEAFRRAVRLEPADVELYAALAEAERRRGNYPAAIASLESARLHLRSESQRRALERALRRLYHQAGMLPGLISKARRGIDVLHQRLLSTLLELARALEGEGREKEAREVYRRIVELAPGSEQAAEARRRLANPASRPAPRGG